MDKLLKGLLSKIPLLRLTEVPIVAGPKPPVCRDEPRCSPLLNLMAVR